MVNTGGFGDALNTPLDGMDWGILVDTGGNGFLAGDYLSFTIDVDGGYLSTIDGLTDDWLAFSDSGILETVSAGPLGSGSIGSGDFTLDVGEVNDAIALIWFATDTALPGDAYGLGEHANFYVYAGNDVSEAPDGWVPGYAEYNFLAAVPEPAALSALLGLAGLVVALRRRRR